MRKVASVSRSRAKWKDISRGADSGSARMAFLLESPSGMCASSSGKQSIHGQSQAEARWPPVRHWGEFGC